MTQNEDAFWRFCAATLAVSGVADLSRALQERFAADQSLVLYMLWRGTQGARLDHVEMGQALAAAAHWRTRVVAPLQQVFRHLRQPPPGFIGADALMQSVQRAQAEAERLAQAAPKPAPPLIPRRCGPISMPISTVSTWRTAPRTAMTKNRMGPCARPW